MNTTTEQPKRQEVDYATLEKVNISYRRPAKWYMYVIKRVLRTKDIIDALARPSAAAQLVRVIEALIRLGYITILSQGTISQIHDGIVQRFLIVKIKKTANFDKLYDAREEERKKIIESKEQQK